MDNIKNNHNVFENLDESTKNQIKEIGLPYPLSIHISKSKKMDDSINEFLSKIKKDISELFGGSISYIISELTDNIEQHSEYSNAFIFVNPKNEYTQVVIYDDGLSIPTVFEKNNINFSKDSEAIEMALNGKTTKKEDILRGFGLRTTQEIVKALNGKMQIISKKGMLIVQDSLVNLTDFENGKLPGTLIHLKLKTPTKTLNIYPYLE